MEHSKDYPQDVTSEKELDPTSDDKEPSSASGAFTAGATATSDGGKASISKDEVAKTGKASEEAMEEQEVETSEEAMEEQEGETSEIPRVRDASPFDKIGLDLRSTILVEMMRKEYKLVELMSHLRVRDLWEVVHKRLVPDPHRESHTRALVVFSSRENTRKAFQTLNSSRSYFCSVIAHDVISGIKRLEQTLKGFNSDFQQENEVLVSELPPDQKESDMKNVLFKYFSKAGVVKRITVPPAPGGCAHEAFIRYSSLSEAFLAELAFDDMFIRGKKLRVAMVDNIAFQQLSLFSKLAHSIVECNENSEKTELWKQFSKIKIRPGCSYLECRKCYSGDQEVLLRYPETNIPKDDSNAEKPSASSVKE